MLAGVEILTLSEFAHSTICFYLYVNLQIYMPNAKGFHTGD